MGIFGNLFDLNHDGKMDSFEKAAELGFLAHITESEEEESEEDDYGFDDEDEDEYLEDTETCDIIPLHKKEW